MLYHLSTFKGAKLVSQKKRKLGEKRRQVVKVEANNLLKPGFVNEERYTTWLANVMLVKKASGKLPMCIDHTTLNKAYFEDSYHLPNIDRLVDGVVGHNILSFLGAYSGYNQILVVEDDKMKSALIIEDANNYYEVIPFSLKIVEVMYQRLIHRVFDGKKCKGI